MGRRPAKLKVELAVAARTDLDRILRYNLRHFGQRHAESYLAFLRSQIDGLARDYPFGLSIEGHPGLRYHIMKRRPGGD
ncbi:MAG: type II toxin-antitoxin system RelE/ParE family toxin, partial [Fimbriimonadaceae bacterium]|nr:type II toxin-antitoxin system RelE/ParE family toxin [Fimbriimonadaceae bacterium]